MVQSTPQTFLSMKEAAARCGISVQALIKRGMPPADAHIGDVSGWTTETIDTWQASWAKRRPGRYPKSEKPRET